MMDRAQFMRELEELLADISERGRMPLSFIIIISMMRELRMRLR